MPCIPMQTENLTKQRQQEIRDALARLEEALDFGDVTIAIGPQGAVALDGWSEQDRQGITDVCAIRTLTSEGSWELRKAMASAEDRTGRSVALAEVEAGTHRHGSTWHPGH